MINTILFVDDDVADYKLFSEIVYDLSTEAKVVHVKDVCEIDAFLILPSPDIIVLDMNMPKLNGIDFLKKIRADKNFNNIPVIMYSVVNENAEEAYRYAAN